MGSTRFLANDGNGKSNKKFANGHKNPHALYGRCQTELKKEKGTKVC
jgi:hypothetical protein